MTNTILVTVDALRPSRLRQYGASRNPMPVLDEIIKDGTKFTSAYANGPYTGVSIPSIHTSRNLGRRYIDVGPTIASVLSEHEIETGFIGTKSGFAATDVSAGFDDFFDFGKDNSADEVNKENIVESILNKLSYALIDGNDRIDILTGKNNQSTIKRNVKKVLLPYQYANKAYHSAEEVSDKAIKWIESRSDSDFFLWLHYMEGHRPYGIHHDNYKYVDKEIDNHRIFALSKKAGTNPSSLKVTEHRLLLDLYDSNLFYCSEQISRLLGKLKDLNIYDDTNLVFTSDHGEEFFDHGMYFHRNLPYDELLHVPLFLKTTENQRAVVEEPRELLDIGPTICAEHGLKTEDLPFEGTHLLTDEERQVIALGCGHLPIEDDVIAVRDNGWKYLYVDGEKSLYNLADNKSEINDVSEENPGVVDQLHDSIPDEYFGTEANRWKAETKADKEQLEALGYLELKE